MPTSFDEAAAGADVELLAQALCANKSTNSISMYNLRMFVVMIVGQASMWKMYQRRERRTTLPGSGIGWLDAAAKENGLGTLGPNPDSDN